MKRSTIEYWVYCCPSCGYCATDPGEVPKGIDELVYGDAYQQALHKPDYPAKCNEFLCKAMICEATGDFHSAAWATLYAAWICDDEGLFSFAAVCRLRAEALGRESEAKGQGLMEPAEASVALRCDLLRRAGAFSEVLTIIDSFSEAPELNDPFLRNLLQLEKTLAVAGDCAAHTMDEVSNGQVREDKQDKRAPLTTFTRFLHQQLARLWRAD